ncbi:unnamed protein product [Lampetra planeri]
METGIQSELATTYGKSELAIAAAVIYDAVIEFRGHHRATTRGKAFVSSRNPPPPPDAATTRLVTWARSSRLATGAREKPRNESSRVTFVQSRMARRSRPIAARLCEDSSPGHRRASREQQPQRCSSAT